MSYYFTLHLKRFIRFFKTSGLHPFLAALLLVTLFVGISIFLFQKTEYASYIYVAMAWVYMGLLGSKERNEFLKISFKVKQFYIIRLLENFFVALPFIVVLFLDGSHKMILVLLILSFISVFTNTSSIQGIKIPTPFSKRPFEWVSGFRRSFIFIFMVYALTVIAVVVGNFSLGLASIIFLFLISFTFYTKPEDEFYIWVFGVDSKQFLIRKIKIAFINITKMSILPAMGLYTFFPEMWLIIIGVQLFGYLLLSAVILAKYSAFPQEMNIIQLLFLGLCLWFPPMLLIVIPLFYKKSKNNLAPYLK